MIFKRHRFFAVPLLTALTLLRTISGHSGNADNREKPTAAIPSPSVKPAEPASLNSEGKISPSADAKMLALIGARRVSATTIELGHFQIDHEKKQIRFPARLNMQEGVIEVLVCTGKGRTHESLLITAADPFKLQLALFLLGAKNGSRLVKDGRLPPGTFLQIDIEPENGQAEPAENWLINSNSGKQTTRLPWIFSGSNFNKGICLATQEGNLVNINSMDQNTIIAPPLDETIEKTIFIVNKQQAGRFRGKKDEQETISLPVTVIISTVNRKTEK